jgi:5,10-methenyltetrahydromethanopterin hydrogenase
VYSCLSVYLNIYRSISWSGINLLISVMETCCVFLEVGTEYLNINKTSLYYKVLAIYCLVTITCVLVNLGYFDNQTMTLIDNHYGYVRDFCSLIHRL